MSGRSSDVSVRLLTRFPLQQPCPRLLSSHLRTAANHPSRTLRGSARSSSAPRPSQPVAALPIFACYGLGFDPRVLIHSGARRCCVGRPWIRGRRRSLFVVVDAKSRRTELEQAMDQHIGRAIRARRRQLGQTQLQLAQAIGRSFQQVQKFESGKNRVPASLLYSLGLAQGLHAGAYFVGFGENPDG